MHDDRDVCRIYWNLLEAPGGTKPNPLAPTTTPDDSTIGFSTTGKTTGPEIETEKMCCLIKNKLFISTQKIFHCKKINKLNQEW